MSSFSIREKIWFDRLVNAERIRKSIKYSHYLKDNKKILQNPEETSDQIFRIGKSLNELKVLREKRSLLQIMQKNKARFNKSALLKPRNRNLFLSNETSRKKPLISWTESISPTRILPKLPKEDLLKISPIKSNPFDQSSTLKTISTKASKNL
jgi:hypothetical protein